VRRAREAGVPSAVLTFDPDPAHVVSRVTGTRLLDPAEKTAFIAQLGPDLIVVVPFDEELARWSPERFVTDILVASLSPALVVVGPEFRFGAGASGDAATLERSCADNGCRVELAEPLSEDGDRISSTRIRGLLAQGDVRSAAALLGRPHRLSGPVRQGRGAGASLLGMATANVDLDEHAALPASGVYAGVATTDDGVRWPAAISVGTPPMFPEARDVLEVRLVGFDGDLYGHSLTVEFLERIREQRRFDGLDALAEAMKADVAATVELTRGRL
jgi:riboflavin kinase/FMN adenylyltransferase